jgi:hypothetical protein
VGRHQHAAPLPAPVLPLEFARQQTVQGFAPDEAKDRNKNQKKKNQKKGTFLIR